MTRCIECGVPVRWTHDYTGRNAPNWTHAAQGAERFETVSAYNALQDALGPQMNARPFADRLLAKGYVIRRAGEKA